MELLGYLIHSIVLILRILLERLLLCRVCVLIAADQILGPIAEDKALSEIQSRCNYLSPYALVPC
jgi:hypothetical protein